MGGDVLTITGDNFDPYTITNNAVALEGGAACAVSAATKTTITCTLAAIVSPATTPQKVSVTVNAKVDNVQTVAISQSKNTA